MVVCPTWKLKKQISRVYNLNIFKFFIYSAIIASGTYPKALVTKKWQQLWDENPHKKLFQIQPILKERKLDPNNTREETTRTQLHIEHTQLAHSFILKEDPPPKCPCGNQYSSIFW